ncbi:hypothetical protein Cgig2_018389 [Carnegiea gigantea]|uniref:Uncharacterized protein n=1 Tax=Carnegiea gigantea TaxID=171969 RepID=A0A9Q1GP31_9CARY|nr:hypothetical protein Cgig2_009115 [Carnegiea gigantea]KAJ8423553.1 hypothetical protein Cgig2_018389 [Carnegiea gigantea]
MYVTRPLCLYKSHPDLLSVPPEGLGSGYLILEDADDVGKKTREPIKDLPFPQNKLLTVEYTLGEDNCVDKAAFIPVVDQLLSSNSYHVIVAKDDDKKVMSIISMQINGIYIPDKPPKTLDSYDIDQQFEIFKRTGESFSARSVDPDSFPPTFLRRSGWKVHASDPKSYPAGEASGINSALRSQLADFNFPVSREQSLPVSVGKWYGPFMFVREGTQKEQMERTMFYKLTLEQRWERISACKNGDVGGNTVALTVVVPTEVVRISWTEAIPERDEAKTKNEMGLQVKIGLSLVIIERMTWEQERVGWVHGNEKQVMVARMEKYQGGDSWQKFGCYMLVEQFVLKRLDRSLVLTYDFNHTNRIRCKWE